MTAIIWALVQRFGGWIAAGFSVVAAIFFAMRSARNAGFSVVAAIFFAMRSARNVGKAEAEVKAAQEETKRNEEIAVREIEAARDAASVEVGKVKGANDVQANVNRLDSGDAANELRDKWTRD